jgi:hypothetical protein
LIHQIGPRRGVNGETGDEEEAGDEIETRKREKRQGEKLGGGIQFARAWMFDGYQGSML